MIQETGDPMKPAQSFHPYAAVTIVFWSLAYVLTRLTLQYFTPFSLGFLRYLAASCTVLLVLAWKQSKLPRLADLPWISAAGCVGFFLYMILFNLGQSTVTACTASVVIATVPVITALFARLFYRERLRAYQWAAMGVEFAGVLVLTLMNGVLSVNLGVLWLLLAALCLSAYNILQRRLIRSYSPFQASAYSILAGTLLLAVFAPVSIREVQTAPAIQFLYIAALGIFPSAIAYIAWAKAFSLAPQTSQVSNYMFVTPFLTSVFGFLLIGEVPDRATLFGGGIILLGVFWFNFGAKLLRALRGGQTKP